MIATDVLAPRDRGEAMSIVANLAHEHLWLVGAGSQADSMPRPAPDAVTLTTRSLGQVTEYEPADLTVTVESGCDVVRLQETLSKAGQFLPCDYPAAGTVGGLIASGAVGPSALGYGALRDRLLGMTVITPEGNLTRSGSRVVKSVAGFDLPRLYCGSFGTLGLIVEATLKVAPLPAQSQILAFTGKRADLAAFAERLLGSQLRPTSLTARAQIPEAADDHNEASGSLLVGVAGAHARVRRQVEEIRQLSVMAGLDESDAAPDDGASRHGTQGGASLTLFVDPASARKLFVSFPLAGALHADLGIGRIRLETDAVLPRRALTELEEGLSPGDTLSCTTDEGPVVRRHLQPEAAALIRRLKHALDPTDRFNRGLLEKLL